MMKIAVVILVLASGVAGAETEEKPEYEYSRPFFTKSVTDPVADGLEELKGALGKGVKDLGQQASTQFVTESKGPAKLDTFITGMINTAARVVGKPMAEKLGFVDKGGVSSPVADDDAGKKEGSSLLQQSGEEEAAKENGFLAKRKVGEVSALDSPTIRQRLEELSGQKVDAEKLKKSFLEDNWAAAKTVLHSVPMFKYLNAKRGGAFDKDTQVEGMAMVKTESQTEAETATGSGTDPDCVQDELIPCNTELAKVSEARATPPKVEAQIEREAIAKIYDDYQRNKKEIDARLQKQATAEFAAPQKSFKILKYMAENNKLIPALKDPLNQDKWSMPVEEDVEVADFLDKRENSLAPPDQLVELNDIPDWLNNKI